MSMLETLKKGIEYIKNGVITHPTVNGINTAIQDSPDNIFGIDRYNLDTPQKRINATLDVHARLNPITAGVAHIIKTGNQYFNNTQQPKAPQQKAQQQSYTPPIMREANPIHNWPTNMPQRSPIKGASVVPLRESPLQNYENMTKWLGY